MRVVIIRHGKADQASPTGRDEDRELLPKGRAQAVWLAAALRERGLVPGSILASRMTRARETARLIAEGLGMSFELVPELETDRAASEALELIARRASVPTLALVGHNPQLSRLAAVLWGGPGGADAGGAVELRTGEAVVLDVGETPEPGGATLIDRLRRPKGGG